MPRRIHEDPQSKSRAVSENLRHRFNGETVLSSKNEADNPMFNRFGSGGKLEAVTLNGPFEEEGYGVYAEGPGFPNIGKQADVPRVEPYFEQRTPLVVGNSPPDAKKPSRLSPYALPPQLELVATGQVGFTQGWHSVVWGYGIEVNGTAYITNCSPLYTLYIDQGRGLRLTIPGGVPENVPLLFFGITKPFATELEAANATEVFVQKKESTSPRVKSTTEMWGPYQRTKKFPFVSGQNQTFLEYISRPNTWVKGGGKTFEGRFSFYFNTHFGKSFSAAIATYKVKGKTLYWQPKSWHPLAKTWTPQWIDSEGNWREFGKRSRSQNYAAIAWNNIEGRENQSYDSEIRDTDESGVEAPDSAVEAVTIGPTLPPPGRYGYRLTKYGTEPDTRQLDESPPSPIAHITTTAGFIPRAAPPKNSGNRIPNAEANQRNNDGGLVPQGWGRPTSQLVAYDDSVPGVQTVDDVSNSSSSADIFLTPQDNVQDKQSLVHVAKITINRRTTGTAQYVARQTNLDNSTTDFVLASFTALGDHHVRVRVGGIVNAQQGPGEHFARLGYNPNVKEVRFILRHFGAGVNGTRNLSTSISNVGTFLGATAPHKRYSVDPVTLAATTNEQDASVSTEPPNNSYPVSGYCHAVINPEDRHRAIMSPGVYVPGNMIEFFAPTGTPVVSSYFMGNMRMSVRPLEQRTISFYFFWEGVTKPGTPLRLLVKNTEGAVVQDLGAFVSNATGDSNNQNDSDDHGYVRRKITFITSPEAAYVEVISGGVGDGLWRVMGWQNELGATATEFTDDYAPQGSLVSTFDLDVPGVPEGTFKGLAKIGRISGFGAEVTHVFDGTTQVTAHTVFARSKHREDEFYGEWTADPAQLWIPPRGEGTVQIGTILSTTDLDQTPILHSHFFDFERTKDFAPGAYGTLCRSDGSEFDGTVTVYGFQPVEDEKPLTEEVFADNTPGYAVYGQSREWVRGWGVEMFLDKTAEELMKLVGQGLEVDDDGDEEIGLLVVEYERVRYTMRVLKIDVVVEEREAYLEVKGTDEERYLLRADGLEGEVLSREAF